MEKLRLPFYLSAIAIGLLAWRLSLPDSETNSHTALDVESAHRPVVTQGQETQKSTPELQTFRRTAPAPLGDEHEDLGAAAADTKSQDSIIRDMATDAESHAKEAHIGAIADPDDISLPYGSEMSGQEIGEHVDPLVI